MEYLKLVFKKGGQHKMWMNFGVYLIVYLLQNQLNLK